MTAADTDKPVKGAPRGSGYERAADDFYVEPAWAVEALFDREIFLGDLWDPACGSGTIPSVARARGFECAATDLRDRGYPFCRSGVDFLQQTVETAPAVESIVTNPPYGLAEEFVRHALTLTDHKVAVIVRLAFLEGQKRRALFESTPLARVLVFSRRVSMPPGGTQVDARNGAVAYAWLVWEHGWRGAPVMGWL